MSYLCLSVSVSLSLSSSLLSQSYELGYFDRAESVTSDRCFENQASAFEPFELQAVVQHYFLKNVKKQNKAKIFSKKERLNLLCVIFNKSYIALKKVLNTVTVSSLKLAKKILLSKNFGMSW